MFLRAMSEKPIFHNEPNSWILVVQVQGAEEPHSALDLRFGHSECMFASLAHYMHTG